MLLEIRYGSTPQLFLDIMLQNSTSLGKVCNLLNPTWRTYLLILIVVCTLNQVVHFNCLKPYKDPPTSTTVPPPQEVLDVQPHPPPPTCTGAGGPEEAHKSVFVPIPLEAAQDVPEDGGQLNKWCIREENTPGGERQSRLWKTVHPPLRYHWMNQMNFNSIPWNYFFLEREWCNRTIY